MITSLKEPIAIKRDGDNYKYLTENKLEFFRPNFVFPGDYKSDPTDPFRLALLPTGMIAVFGIITVESSSADNILFRIPIEYQTAQPLLAHIFRLSAGDVLSSAVFFNRDVSSIQTNGAPLVLGDQYWFTGMQYVPKPII